MANLYHLLPKMDDLLAQAHIQQLISTHGREQVLNVLREIMQSMRESITRGEMDEDVLRQSIAGISERAACEIKQSNIPSLRRVINATGVPLHTNLGRAPLAEEAIAAVVEAARGYSTLEYNLDKGERGSRHDHVRGLLCEITGAQDAVVFNNNAGAVLIVLSALAKGREVIVSRGQLVEVGGSFRIPDVMEQGGAVLREVGATNKTHLRDYERAITENTAALLKVHTSNFKLIGFTEEVSTEAMVELSHRKGLLALEDLGSGVLMPGYGEPTVQETVAAGMDVVTFSGDKLMGGPQAGLVVGKAECIARIRSHPLARALRIDKMTLAALEATLRLYRYTDHRGRIPLVSMLNASPAELKQRAQILCSSIELIPPFAAEVVKTTGQVGGGSLPGKEIPGYAVALSAPCGCTKLELLMRRASVPIVARIVEDRVLIDPRAILAQDEAAMLESLQEVAEALK